uniref:Cytochrome P450 n=1 Tax=Timema poppense TaxID=170557 RepID=A0A7R9DK11_TIMPO|nr:unnamed protein product [Timema poppensis]
MRLCDEYGPIWKLQCLGDNMVILTNEEDIEEHRGVGSVDASTRMSKRDLVHREDLQCIVPCGLDYVQNRHRYYFQQLLSNTKYITKSELYQTLMPWLNDGLLTSTGAKWHSRRKLLTSAFHFKILEEFIPIFNKNSRIFVEKLSEYVDKGCVPINKLVSLCTLDIICGAGSVYRGMMLRPGALFVAGSVVSVAGSTEVDIRAMGVSELMFYRMLSPWLWRSFTLFLSPTGWEQRKILRTLHGFTEKVRSTLLEATVIKERRAEYKEAAKKHGSFPDQLNNTNKKRLTFMDLLIEVAEREGTLSNKEIREEVDTFMFEVRPRL